MSTNENDISDVKQAAEQVNVEQIEKNLEDKQQAHTPKELTEEQATSFIDEEVRTDK